ncbi:MAG: hypothetical protein K9N05_08710 [Candidatus Marinimicrobia bacterium]|nr:hypothetical protein [Candidatus Neomarinimicrobiota bacterium]
MNNRIFKSILLFFVLGTLLFAQGIPKLELTIVDEKVNMTQTEKEGRVAITYKPGDIIRYTIIATNTGDGVLTSPLITDPIPQGVSYNPYTAKGLNSVITYSVNNGQLFQVWPPTYIEKDENGRNVEKLASPDMVTHVRWELMRSLAPNESHQFEFEVIVK